MCLFVSYLDWGWEVEDDLFSCFIWHRLIDLKAGLICWFAEISTPEVYPYSALCGSNCGSMPNGHQCRAQFTLVSWKFANPSETGKKWLRQVLQHWNVSAKRKARFVGHQGQVDQNSHLKAQVTVAARCDNSVRVMGWTCSEAGYGVHRTPPRPSLFLSQCVFN